MSLAFSSFPLSFSTATAMRSSVSMGLSAQSGSDFAKTLPGVTGPLDFFDPLGLTEELTKEEVLRFREAELAHGRVSMVAALGFLVQENFHPLFPDIGGSAARQLDTVLQTETGQGIMASLLFTVMLTEIQRARVGWMPPSEGMQQLRPEYVPGDLGFDPLGMRPSSDADLLAMKNKELNNGRLAMLAVAYFAAEEVLGGTPELLGSA